MKNVTSSYRNPVSHWSLKWIWLVALVYCPLSYTYDATSVSVEFHVTAAKAEEACVNSAPDNDCSTVHFGNLSAKVWIFMQGHGANGPRSQPCSAYSGGAGEPDVCDEYYFFYASPVCLNGSCNPKENAGGEGPLTCHP
ncbi:hypothetical protein, partial [Aurantivibrio infirmus]